MKILDNIKSRIGIHKTTGRHELTEDEVRREMELALDEAWKTTDPATKRRQDELFPEGKPSLEEFITQIAKRIE